MEVFGWLTLASPYQATATVKATSAGRVNYCPVLVGVIGGARWGTTSIPEQALAHCAILVYGDERKPSPPANFLTRFQGE